MSFARDILWPLLEDMGSGLGSFFGLKVDDVLKSPEEYSPATAVLMDVVAQTVVQPVASIVLVTLFVVELSRISMITDGDGESFLRRALFTLVKYILVKLAFDNAGTIMSGIYGVFSEIANKANLTTISSTNVDASLATQFLDSVDKMDWLGQTLLIILMLIAWLVNKGAVILALALVVMRFVKIYIFTAFAPMPMAFFASTDTRPFAIGFLRNYAAAVLQALVLVLSFAIYQAISVGWGAKAFENLGENAIAAATSIGSNYIFMGVVLAMIVLGSGRLANELLGN